MLISAVFAQATMVEDVATGKEAEAERVEMAMAVTEALDIRSLAKQDAYKYTEKEVHDVYGTSWSEEFLRTVAADYGVLPKL